jgi:hypothetical protein
MNKRQLKKKAFKNEIKNYMSKIDRVKVIRASLARGEITLDNALDLLEAI